MKQLLLRKGRVFAAELPSPQVEPGLVMVMARASCISPGTEAMGIASSAKSLVQRVLEQPDKALKAVRKIKRDGLLTVLGKARDKFEGEYAIGYSAAGVVSEIGEGVTNICLGDRVAVAGAAHAFHASELAVPLNLTVKIPDGVPFDHASTVALGAIAMQGVRRAQVALGETVVVLGCGALGMLTLQMLKAAGCRVIALDLQPARLALAAELGAELTLQPDEQDAVRRILHFTNGHGADIVIVTAATDSNTPLQQAFEMCRCKGRVVLVGVVGREFDREAMYAKELDFVMSTSYGPGRYDEQYERWGVDYPHAYVRWTEKRNMAAYLHLLASGAIRLDRLIGGRFPVDQAEQAYASLSNSGTVLTILEYPISVESSSALKAEPVIAPRHASGERMGLAIVGAGSFVRSVHIPILRSMANCYRVSAVVNRSGVSARNAAAAFMGCHAETDMAAVLASDDVDAVMIGTRHNLHAAQAVQAIRAGKAVFLEKPMCLTEDECADLKAALGSASGLFMVGYNRRFSPFAREIRDRLKGRINPAMIHYTMNAGYLPYDHWTQTAEGGGRFLGEACHVFDLFRFVIGAPVRTISVDTVRPRTESVRSSDNCVTTVTYQDGSVATLLYTAVGNPACQKERMEVFWDERAIAMEDYYSLREYGRTQQHLKSKRQDKGYRAELEAFHRAWVEGIRFPIPWEELLETWEITWRVSREITRGNVEV